MKIDEITIRERLAGLLDRDDLTLDGLVEEADAFLGVLVARQSRYKVADRPDARTIRYYVSQKLLPPPTSYEGGRARYSGSHLARLLWIKKLQSEHHTLKRIAGMLDGAADEDILRELFPSTSRRRPPLKTRIKRERLVSSDAPPSMELVERRSLGHGVYVDVPQQVLGDARATAEVARRLESLARELRDRPKGTNEREDR